MKIKNQLLITAFLLLPLMMVKAQPVQNKWTAAKANAWYAQQMDKRC
jgi:hypothetical protein